MSNIVNDTESQESPVPQIDFTHLHVHTQFSILDGAAPIDRLMQKVKECGMKSLAITDHGNMFGVLCFMKEAKEHGVKPIIGCEVYVAENSRLDKTKPEDRSGYHLVILAKNKNGYRNLSKIVSIGYIEGHYYRPRIDFETLQKYHEDLIVLTACLGGELPKAILNGNMKKAEALVKKYKELFKDDFYLELQNHGMDDQVVVNKALVELSEKFDVKLVATNDVHYINEEDAEVHDILVCMHTKKDLNDPTRMKYTGQEYLKTPQEMAELFKHLPDAIKNTVEIDNKIESYDIKHEIILPRFPLPEGFETNDEYLKHLCYEGAKKLYNNITEEIKNRIDYELEVIENMGFAGYFLIVQDFINEAKKMDVAVGPGRGSAAGSIVAYCTGITAIDPLEYNLLFERFLNPERISMPDVDIDFDDEGRDKVIDYVIKKYGEEKVAQIVTFGTMAAKSSVKSVARVIGLPLQEAVRISNLIPAKQGITLKKALQDVKELADEKESPNKLVAKTLKMAEIMEGLSSHVGVHACGVIIGPDNLMEHVPLSRSKDSELNITQYDGKFVEEVGLLKMDFLGLKNLSIIKDAIKNIEYRHNIKIDIDNIPLDDEKTFNLYKSGSTVGTFQFESANMQIYLRELKPTGIEDLIIMNALYRPGPMDNIPTYIKRKHGLEKPESMHPVIDDIIKSTYGIMIFQEQIMQIAQKMAGFTLGKADILRKAMGKKQSDVMQQQYVEFINGAKKNNIEEEVAKKVWESMKKFAEYGFNRSHSAAYSLLAYKTAYLKANYPAEYMAAVLTHNLNDIKKITTYINESIRYGIPVLGPDINESFINFTVNDKGEVRFGMGAIKNVGENAALSIIKEREENGKYTDFFDFVKRSNLKNVNKRCIEALVMSGAFDNFPEAHRAQYFCTGDNDETTFIEKVIKFAASYHANLQSSQQSLFGEETQTVIDNPEFPYCEPWSKLEQLKSEKEVIGFFITGHPLDPYKIEMQKYCNTTIDAFKEDLKKYEDKELRFCGITSEVAHRTGKTGNPYCSFVIEDKTASYKLMIFGKDYINFKSFLENDYYLYLKTKVQKRFKTDELEVKITHVGLLADLLETNVSNVIININLNAINQNLVSEFIDVVKQNPGKCRFSVVIHDRDEGIKLNMSSSHKVDIKELIIFCEKEKDIRFTLD